MKYVLLIGQTVIFCLGFSMLFVFYHSRDFADLALGCFLFSIGLGIKRNEEKS